MLYNRSTGLPQQDQQDAIFSNDSFVDWLEKQRQRSSYYYHSGACCLIAQYFMAMGMDVYVGHKTYFELTLEPIVHRPLPKGWNEIAQNGEWTYGAALERARLAFDTA